MTTSEKLSIGIAIVISISFTTHLNLTAGWLPATIIGTIGFLLGFIMWMRTSFKYPTDPKKLLVPYLLTTSFLMFHIVEEYIFDFGARIAAFSGSQWTTGQFIWTIGLGFPVIWIYGAYAIAKRQKFGGFISWFMFMGMLIGEPTHILIFPVREMITSGGVYEYFPGLWTAMLPFVPGVWGIYIILKDTRQQKAEAKEREQQSSKTFEPVSAPATS